MLPFFYCVVMGGDYLLVLMNPPAPTLIAPNIFIFGTPQLVTRKIR